MSRVPHKSICRRLPEGRPAAVGFSCLLAASAAAGDAFDRPPPLCYVNSHTVVLNVEAAEGAAVQRTDVWISSDEGRHWRPIDSALSGGASVRFDVPRDGRYGCYVVLENRAGRSASPPRDGAEPHCFVLVDTEPPTLQLHSAERISREGEPVRVRVRLTLLEENLAESGARFFFRLSESDAWRDGGVLTRSGDTALWEAPPDAVGEVDLRVVVTDLAGNRAADQLDRVPVGNIRRSADPPASRPAATASAAPATSAGAAASQAAAPRLSPPWPETDPFDRAADRPSLEEVQRLRARAMEHLADGEMSLGIARLEDALSLAGDDADVLADVGQALIRARRPQEAAQRFRDALLRVPEHAASIEGLALVAVSEKRYPEAREQLLRLSKLQPDAAALWLRLGDVEHQLGNRGEARRAWQKCEALSGADAALREKAGRRLRSFAGPESGSGTARGDEEKPGSADRRDLR